MKGALCLHRGKLALKNGQIKRFLEFFRRAGERSREHVENFNRETRLSAKLGDAQAHRAGSDDSDTLDHEKQPCQPGINGSSDILWASGFQSGRRRLYLA